MCIGTFDLEFTPWLLSHLDYSSQFARKLQFNVRDINKKPCKKESVFKVAILLMLKCAQSAEYAQTILFLPSLYTVSQI